MSRRRKVKKVIILKPSLIIIIIIIITEEKVPMTAPVITRVIPGAGPACESNFTISFFISFANQANPPKPTNSDVFISMIPEHESFVR